MTPETLRVYPKMCGWSIARARARFGDRVAIASYLGSGDAFDRAIATFVASYADQNQADYQARVDAIADGTVHAELGFKVRTLRRRLQYAATGFQSARQWAA